jgi:hypothetical protein
MIEDIKDLELDIAEGTEDIDKRIQEKLGLSIQDLKEYLSKWVSDNSFEIASTLINIAPHGDYGELMEDEEKMAMFLKSEIKTDSWELQCVSCVQSMLQFSFLSSAIDDGETFKGYVIVNFLGKIMHAFCQGDN